MENINVITTNPELKEVSLADILNMEASKYSSVVVTPENYFELKKFAYIANKNKDVEINFDDGCVVDKFLDSSGFYGVEITMLFKRLRPNGVTKYTIVCDNAIRR